MECEAVVKVLIVEDEALVAMNMAYSLEDAGHEVVGCASDRREALHYAERGADLAFVDVNLMDGPTGPGIGAELAERYGLRVMFVTANPRQLGDGVPGTLGVISKPCGEQALCLAAAYAAAPHSEAPPPGFQPFAQPEPSRLSLAH